MTQQQPFMTAIQNGRRFACSAVAVQAIVVNSEERILLLSSPTRNRPGEWQIISGGLEAAETVVDGVLREACEEAGSEVILRPLGVVHAQTFHYDAQLQYMIGIYYLCAYEGGVIQPGDDMQDARYQWWSLEELMTADPKLHPSTHLWMLQRAVMLYRCWRDQPEVLLQPPLDI